MEHPILTENRSKRIDRSLWQLICFAMFCFWQMGFIYFVGPSLTIDGKTPLPIDMENAMLLIAASYVLSILWMLLLPGTVVWTQRIAAGLAIASAVGLFLPLSAEVMRLLIFVQIVTCCVMIGFETFLVVCYFTERTAIRYMTIAYGVACALIALLQNDLLPVPFSIFRFLMTGALVLLMLFLVRMPSGREAQPRFLKRGDGLTAPKHLLIGGGVLIFVAALMGVSGPAVAEEVTNGVSLLYLCDAIVSVVVYLLYRRANLHPFRVIPFLVGLGGIGYLLLFASAYVPALGGVACVFIGFGMVPCQMLPLYGAVMMQSYPSRAIPSGIIGLALTAVLVQGGMVELFRPAPTMLLLAYAVIMAVLVFVYAQIEPFLLFTLRRRRLDGADAPLEEQEEPAAADEPKPLLSVLTAKEKQVAELICLGFTNRDIAKVLFITEHTAKDHTKRIYRKLGVHSRIELATLVSSTRPTGGK